GLGLRWGRLPGLTAHGRSTGRLLLGGFSLLLGHARTARLFTHTGAPGGWGTHALPPRLLVHPRAAGWRLVGRLLRCLPRVLGRVRLLLRRLLLGGAGQASAAFRRLFRLLHQRAP